MKSLAQLAFILTLALPTSALSQEAESPQDVVANGQKIGAWTVSCIALAVGKTNCTLNQRVMRTSDGAFVADVIALRDSEGRTYLLARVPVGAALPSGFIMSKADSEETTSFTWQACSPEVCEATLPLDPEQVTELSAEDNQMIAAFRPNLQSEPIVFQISLSGMEAGLDAVSQ